MFFEFIKFEETTWRDFTTLGKGTDEQSPFGKDGGDLDGGVLELFRNDMLSDRGSLILWGSPLNVTVINDQPPTDKPAVAITEENRFDRTRISVVVVFSTIALLLIAFVGYIYHKKQQLKKLSDSKFQEH
jgi:hypothetical protein